MPPTLAAATAATAATLGGASVAGASPPPAASGTEHFQIMTTSATATTSSIIGDGVFTAGGTATGTNSGTSSKSAVTFPGGTFVITHFRGTGTQHFNPRTCLLQISENGPYTLGRGTGAYAHLTGRGTYRLSILAVGAKSGGKCSKTLPPPTWQQVITASGPVSLP